MGDLLAYTLISSIVLTGLYLVYRRILAEENQHGFNRGVIWMIYAVALTAPLCDIDFTFLRSNRPLTDGTIEIIANGIEVMMTEVEHPTWTTIAIWVYTAGIAGALIMTIITIARLGMILRSGHKMKKGNYTIVLTDKAGTAPFSWLKYIVMSPKDYLESGDMILLHEESHLRRVHWLDLLLAQAVCILQWYNPTSWLMRDELKSVHEYQADATVLTSGADAKKYQILLIKKAVGTRFPSIANSLNHSNLKKRVTMMYKSKTSKARRMAALALVPTALICLSVTHLPAVAKVLSEASEATLSQPESKVSKKENAIQTEVSSQNPQSQKQSSTIIISSIDGVDNGEVDYYVDGKKVDASTAKKTDAEHIERIEVRKDLGETPAIKITTKSEPEENHVFTAVEQMPQYPGGEAELFKFLANNIRYPEQALKDNVEGRVVVKFIVDKTGNAVDPQIVRSQSPELDAEAMRVVGLLKFTPGKFEGKPVNCSYVLPISFKLESEKSEETK